MGYEYVYSTGSSIMCQQDGESYSALTDNGYVYISAAVAGSASDSLLEQLQSLDINEDSIVVTDFAIVNSIDQGFSYDEITADISETADYIHDLGATLIDVGLYECEWITAEEAQTYNSITAAVSDAYIDMSWVSETEDGVHLTQDGVDALSSYIVDAAMSLDASRSVEVADAAASEDALGVLDAATGLESTGDVSAAADVSVDLLDASRVWTTPAAA